MSDLDQSLRIELQDADYRYAYAESFLNTKIATQIKTLREHRGQTQAEVAALIGIKQPGYRRFEDVNHSVWRTDSLWSIARALGVRLNISFETFGSLLEEKKHFNKGNLRRPKFEEDRVFQEPTAEQHVTAILLEQLQVSPQELEEPDWAKRIKLGLEIQDGRKLLSAKLKQIASGKAVAGDSAQITELTPGLKQRDSTTAALELTAQPRVIPTAIDFDGRLGKRGRRAKHHASTWTRAGRRRLSYAR